MQWGNIRDVVVPIIGGLVFARTLLFTSLFLVFLNTRWTPNFPWYPIAVLALIIVATVLVNRRWDIGLTIPRNMPWGRIYAFGIAISVTGFAVATLQGAYYDLVRGTEGGAGDVSPLFQLANAFVISMTAATLAELGFRGIILPRIAKVMGVWPAIVLVTVINTAGHRWIDSSTRWLGLLVMLGGWGYLRQLSGSVVPPLVIHVTMNFLLAIGFWFWGPWDLGAMTMSELVSFAALALLSFVAAIYFARSVQAER